jgi:hypothetical protein
MLLTIGSEILVIPQDPWELFFEGVRELSDDFMTEGRSQPEVEQRVWEE